MPCAGSVLCRYTRGTVLPPAMAGCLKNHGRCRDKKWVARGFAFPPRPIARLHHARRRLSRFLAGLLGRSFAVEHFHECLDDGRRIVQLFEDFGEASDAFESFFLDVLL